MLQVSGCMSAVWHMPHGVSSTHSYCCIFADVQKFLKSFAYVKILIFICTGYSCPFSSSFKIVNLCWLAILLNLDFWDAPRECNLDPCDIDLRSIFGSSACTNDTHNSLCEVEIRPLLQSQPRCTIIHTYTVYDELIRVQKGTRQGSLEIRHRKSAVTHLIFELESIE